MIIGNNHLIENRIVLELSNKPSQTAKQLTRSISQNGPGVSFQAVYLALAKLEKEAVVVKNSLKYSVAIHWSLELSRLSEKLIETHLLPEQINSLLPTTSQPKRTWVIQDPRQLNLFWAQLLLTITHTSHEKIMYDYNHQLWFQLIHKDWEAQYWNAQFSKIKQGYIIVTHDNYWNRKILKEDFHFPNAHTHILKRHILGLADESVYTTIFDDLILSVKLDPKMIENINSIFQLANPSALHTQEIITKILLGKIKAKITLEKNQNKATMYKKKFEQVFGPIK